MDDTHTQLRRETHTRTDTHTQMFSVGSVWQYINKGCVKSSPTSACAAPIVRSSLARDTAKMPVGGVGVGHVTACASAGTMVPCLPVPHLVN